jgi:hypothetical protein
MSTQMHDIPPTKLSWKVFFKIIAESYINDIQIPCKLYIALENCQIVLYTNVIFYPIFQKVAKTVAKPKESSTSKLILKGQNINIKPLLSSKIPVTNYVLK